MWEQYSTSYSVSNVSSLPQHWISRVLLILCNENEKNENSLRNHYNHNGSDTYGREYLLILIMRREKRSDRLWNGAKCRRGRVEVNLSDFRQFFTSQQRTEGCSVLLMTRRRRFLAIEKLWDDRQGARIFRKFLQPRQVCVLKNS